ncbi:MOSC domain-containing protein [Burkholderia sp. MSMB1589WGS]|uniref:MOSC domain-containing protein n=1 Tax=Burkholderia sp. MSMB1589WGS TaxID=1636425 RepID=UPI0007BA472B|nr:MOSC domain-containing protein [Burkholderia sp. MSMB1589WGS]
MHSMNAKLDALLIGAIRPLADTAHASAIGKQPVHERLWLARTGFAGDEQADRKHHGGPDKAVHHYAFDHYALWAAEIGPRDVLARPGAFGENLSTRGIAERDVCIGDVFTLGGATLQVSQSRQPCWKLNARFGFRKMSARVQQSGRTGWYYRVLDEGWVEPGGELALRERPHPEWPLSSVLDVLYRRTLDAGALEALSRIDALPLSWRQLFERRLKAGAVEDWTKRLDG